MTALLHRFAWPAAVLFAWLLTWRHLAAEWAADEQYRYGFGVPLLAAWMMRRRFSGALEMARPRLAWCGLVVVALLTLTLGEALAWHDPLWRFTGLALQIGATLLSVAWLFRRGGAPLVRRQLFPLAFAALAVPWPMPVEIWTIRHLAAAVTDAATTAANLLGVAAMQHGNTIELAACTVGVDDACSGIQSLQATLMVSFFLGEFFQLRTSTRIVLVSAGAMISFLANAARVLVLTLLAQAQGLAAAMEWHDFIGGVATVSGLALLLGTAILLARGTILTVPAQVPPTPVRLAEGTAIFAILAVIFLGTQMWFSRFAKSSAVPGDVVVWPLAVDRLPAGWSAESVAPTKSARTMIRFSEWQSFKLRNAEGVAAHVTRLAWDPAARTPAFVTSHTPAVCLPSAGWTPASPRFFLTLKIHGDEIPCAAFSFVREGARLLALQSLSAGGRPELRLMDAARIRGTLPRLATLWQEPLRQITEELLLYLPDPIDAAAREKSATEFLSAVLIPRTK